MLQLVTMLANPIIKKRSCCAEYLYREFFRVALTKFGRSHRDVANVLSGMAQIAHKKHQYDETMKLFEESLSAGREALGEEQLTEIGNLYLKEHRCLEFCGI